MGAIMTVLQLGLAACLSGATAGLLMALSIFLARRFGDPLAGWTGLLATAEFGLTTGILVASWPAFAAGAVLWALARRRQAARRARAWAAAGASVGALAWAMLELTFWTPSRLAHVGNADAYFIAAFLASGAAAALAFRAAMGLGGPGRARRSGS